MNARTDQQLLNAYAQRRNEAAFAELVRRHIDLVHSAAVRMVNDPDLAKDVSQGVFVALAKNAAKLTGHPVLSGWLYLTARNIAAQTVRAEVRRRSREQEGAAMNEHPETDASWEEIAPHLDAVLAALNVPDRDAVLLRYFENKSAQDMATILGISAEAAQKRVTRAIERLRRNFAKRGITAGAAGLVGAISANAVQVAPMGLAAVISTSALAGTSAITTTQVLAMTTLQKTLAAATITALAGVGIYQARQASQLRQEVPNLHQRQDSPSTQNLSKNQIQNPVGLARNSERVVRKNSELEKQNAALQEEKIRAEKMSEINRRQSEWMGRVTEKVLFDKELQAPQTASEFANLYGQVKMRSQNFYEKWNGRLPAAGSPDEAIYQNELDVAITDDATLMKSVAIVGDESMGNPASMAQF